MIWTVVLWLGMQGQAANPCTIPPSACFFSGCEKMAIEIDGGCPVWTTPSEPNAAILLPPAKHVFEIRTTRDLDKPLEGNGLIGCREGFKFIPELRFRSAYSEAYCVRITRELWMDGKRLGIIKGLD